ncbi:MAG TPA: DUF2330 domain-containing protein [Candidatus Eisenbacteria bacterium]|jgi:hypothetical protein
MKRLRLAALLFLSAALSPPSAHSFCGFYVATGDARLFNKSSQVVLVRDEDRTVLTMGSDFKGEPSEFALVVPVPTVLERDQIHVGDQKIVEHLDAYSAPRLVEYFDENPCMMVKYEGKMLFRNAAPTAGIAEDAATRAKALGVTIEARYTVGEYDILILSAKQSNGLETWLNENHYRIPPGASRVLATYLRQGMKFFVAKVNLKEQAKTGFKSLRPLQMAYESPKFMLPIRLGMVNADGPQELFIYALTREGRVETTNYRTVKIPSDAEIPEYVKDAFPDFYRAMFRTAAQKENLEAVFLEYAWDMGWCDPCASEPLTQDELRELGVFWLDDSPGAPGMPRVRGGGQAPFVTRLHVRYDAAHFPEDLVFQQTSDKSNFQGRYILRHPWTGADDCPAALQYRAALRERRAKQASTLAALTGWDLADIRSRMKVRDDWSSDGDAVKWYQKLWKK